MRQGAVPRLGTSLGVDGVLGVAELVQDVESFDASDELALEERLADGGVQQEVVGVEFATAIAATRVHVAVGRECQAFSRTLPKGRSGVAGREAILEVDGVQCLEIVHLAFRVSPAQKPS